MARKWTNLGASEHADLERANTRDEKRLRAETSGSSSDGDIDGRMEGQRWEVTGVNSCGSRLGVMGDCFWSSDRDIAGFNVYSRNSSSHSIYEAVIVDT